MGKTGGLVKGLLCRMCREARLPRSFEKPVTMVDTTRCESCDVRVLVLFLLKKGKHTHFAFTIVGPGVFNPDPARRVVRQIRVVSALFVIGRQEACVGSAVRAGLCSASSHCKPTHHVRGYPPDFNA